jgi:MFS family permease
MTHHSDESPKRAAYPWPFFAVMGASLFLFLSFQALFPISPLYVSELGGFPADNGMATWVFALAALLTRPLAGSLADRLGRRPVLIAGAILLGGGPLLHAFAFDIPTLLVVKAVHGVGLAAFSTAYQPFITDLLPPGRYGEGLGVAGTPSSLAMVVAPLFGEWALETLGFQSSFRAMSAIGGLGLVATLALLGWRQNPTGESSASEGGWLRQALRQPGVWPGALGMAIMGIPFGAFITFVPLLAEARDLGGTGLVYAVYAIATTIARPLAGRATDRWGARPVVLLGFGLAGLAAGAIAAASESWLLLAGATALGAGFGTASSALDSVVQSSVRPSLRGVAAAIQYTAFDTLVGFGGLGLGWLAGVANYGVMYATVGGIVLLGLVVGLLVRLPRAATTPGQ